MPGLHVAHLKAEHEASAVLLPPPCLEDKRDRMNAHPKPLLAPSRAVLAALKAPPIQKRSVGFPLGMLTFCRMTFPRDSFMNVLMQWEARITWHELSDFLKRLRASTLQFYGDFQLAQCLQKYK